METTAHVDYIYYNDTYWSQQVNKINLTIFFIITASYGAMSYAEQDSDQQKSQLMIVANCNNHFAYKIKTCNHKDTDTATCRAQINLNECNYTNNCNCNIELKDGELTGEEYQHLYNRTDNTKAIKISTTDVADIEYCWCHFCANSQFVSTPTGDVNETLDCRAW